MLNLQLESLFRKINQKVGNSRGNLNVQSSFGHLLILSDLGELSLGLLNLGFPVSLVCFHLSNSFLFNLLEFLLPLDLIIFSFLLPCLSDHLLAFLSSLVDVGLLLLFLLEIKKFLYQLVFSFLLIKFGLSICLVNSKLSATSLTLFASEIRLLFRLFDFVHRGWV